ncbi:spore germination protein [Brevibacillus dissolubilis]|uniref:spore germination protein n=1 Tax=Brevibacillus dissolubilis TaxID=1844116 RepID=UPI001115F7C2
MLRFFRKRRNPKQLGRDLRETNQSQVNVDEYAANVKDAPVSSDLDENEQRVKEVFDHCSDIVFRRLVINDETEALIIFVDGIVNSDHINDNILIPLLLEYTTIPDHVSPEALQEKRVSLTQLTRMTRIPKIVDGVLAGNVALFVTGYEECLMLNVIGGTRRSVAEPSGETVIRGPREGFVENLRTNTALLRFRLKSTRLKTKPFIIGEETRTNVVLAYLEGIADPGVIEEAEKRLKAIKIDGVLETGYLEELMEEQPFSPFPQFQYTERPDTVAGQLLEGKFAIFVDGTPFVLTAPVTVWQMIQATEDYYERFLIGTTLRWLRFIFAAIALLTPAMYIAISTYHQDMLPTTLVLSLAASRESIPFPAIVEAMIMEIVFEALREAGIRLPRTIGQAVSILGALVIGQAAVQAGIVSAPMVIIVSITGIASFTIPKYNFAIAIRVLRFPLMFLAAALGLFGIVIGMVWIVLHLCHLRSFGVPYLSGISPYQKNMMKDLFVRAPWWNMKYRPITFNKQNRRRVELQAHPTQNQQEE